MASRRGRAETWEGGSRGSGGGALTVRRQSGWSWLVGKTALGGDDNLALNGWLPGQAGLGLRIQSWVGPEAALRSLTREHHQTRSILTTSRGRWQARQLADRQMYQLVARICDGRGLHTEISCEAQAGTGRIILGRAPRAT